MKVDRIKVLLLLLLLMTAVLVAQEPKIEVKKITPRTVISVIKRVEQEYYLLTKNQPVEFSVTGPTTVRVFTRLLWHDDMQDKQNYKLIVKYGEEEKIVSLESEVSKSAWGNKKQYYGKWRSFYLDVPKGTADYQIRLLEAKSDTVAIRFSLEKPKEYKKKAPEPPYTELQFVEKEKITSYYEVKLNKPIKIKVEGPVRLKATCRLNYDYTLEGKQNFTVSAVVSNKEWQSKTFRVSKSETGLYKNAQQYLPSTPVNFYLNIPPGNYLIEFYLKNTLAQSAGISFYTKPLEDYE